MRYIKLVLLFCFFTFHFNHISAQEKKNKSLKKAEAAYATENYHMLIYLRKPIRNQKVKR